MKVVLILKKSADPDEMQHHAAFHMGLHCLPKYPFRGFQYANLRFNTWVCSYMGLCLLKHDMLEEYGMDFMQ